MKTSPKSWVLDNSHGPFDTSKRLMLGWDVQFYWDRQDRDRNKPFGSTLQSSCSHPFHMGSRRSVLPTPLTLLDISTSTASKMESLPHKGGGRWIPSLPRVLPLNYWGLQQEDLRWYQQHRPLLASMDAFGGFFPPVLLQQWNQSI